MEELLFHPPDPAAMEALLAERRGDCAEVVLALAWRAGLKRKEISALTWPETDLAAGVLRLPDREVPVEPELAGCLKRWREASPAGRDTYVVASPRRRGRMAEQSVSRLARAALDSAGQTEVRLADLRHDFVRRQLRRHDWPYVLRITGISVATYRNGLARLLAEEEAVPESSAAEAEADEGKSLQRIMQREEGSPAGLALRLAAEMGLRNEEIVALTWEQVDLEAGTLALRGRLLALSGGTAAALRETWERRKPGEDPHLLLTERSRKPMSAEWLNTLVRTALIRGGLERRSLGELRQDRQLEEEKRRLLDLAADRGSVTRGEAMELLGLSEGAAYYRLRTLAEQGKLVRVNSRYYLPGAVVPPERQQEAIRIYLAENGPAYLQEIVDLLHIGKRTAARLLRRMAEEGELVLLPRSRRYALPEGRTGAGGLFLSEQIQV